MERRKFFELTGLAVAGLPVPSLPLARVSRFPPPASRPVPQDDPAIDALAALAQARHPGVLSDADVVELKRQAGSVAQSAAALRAVKLTNADAPSCVARA